MVQGLLHKLRNVDMFHLGMMRIAKLKIVDEVWQIERDVKLGHSAFGKNISGEFPEPFVFGIGDEVTLFRFLGLLHSPRI